MISKNGKRTAFFRFRPSPSSLVPRGPTDSNTTAKRCDDNSRIDSTHELLREISSPVDSRPACACCRDLPEVDCFSLLPCLDYRLDQSVSGRLCGDSNEKRKQILENHVRGVGHDHKPVGVVRRQEGTHVGSDPPAQIKIKIKTCST